jgi:hypothetical protein
LHNLSTPGHLKFEVLEGGEDAYRPWMAKGIAPYVDKGEQLGLSLAGGRGTRGSRISIMTASSKRFRRSASRAVR